MKTYSGIPIVGHVTWGSHFCNIYESNEDLLTILIPYFQTGLENNELCIWVTTADFTSEQACAAIRPFIPNLDDLLLEKKLVFYKNLEAFHNPGVLSSYEILAQCASLHHEALAKNYNGVRFAGHVEPLAQGKWTNYMQYEEKVNVALKDHKIIALCCYRLQHCDTYAIMDIIKNHGFVLILRNGCWEMLENATIKILKDEMHSINTQLEQRILDRTAKLEQALSVRDQFILIASHELKTPITSLRLYIDGMLYNYQKNKLAKTENIVTHLEKMRDETISLEQKINSLLDVSTLSRAENISMQFQKVNLGNVVKNLLIRFEKALQVSGCSISTDLNKTVLVWGDPMRLDQAISNLICNATKYAKNSRVFIGIKEEPGWGIFEIKDQGIGIAAKDHKRIFHQFVQLDHMNEQQGFGLGLWLLKTIIDAHQGVIDLNSEVGKGANFQIKIPLMKI